VTKKSTRDRETEGESYTPTRSAITPRRTPMHGAGRPISALGAFAFLIYFSIFLLVLIIFCFFLFSVSFFIRLKNVQI
jgi:hypothetical protein